MARTPTIKAHTQNSQCYTRVLLSRHAYTQLKMLALQYNCTPSEIIEKVIADEVRYERVRAWAERQARQKGLLHND